METEYLNFVHQPNHEDGDAVLVLSGYCNVGKNDIFINPDFRETMEKKDTLRMMEIPYTMIPEENHRCHIFINNDSEEIFNTALRGYIEWAFHVTKRKVVVHIPKSRPFCKVLFIQLICGIEDMIKLVFSKNTYQSFFYVGTYWKNFYDASSRRLSDRYVAITWLDIANKVYMSLVSDINRRGVQTE